MNVQEFHRDFPNKFFLSDQIDGLNLYLDSQGFLNPEEYVVSTEKPGEGNMNKVLRLITNQRTFIIKQARPWVEKYPSIAAPVSRNAIEATYYTATKPKKTLENYSPELLHHDVDNFIMLLSDLGKGSDFLWLYRMEKKIDSSDLSELVAYLNELHQIKATDYPTNLEMRKLNHEHIFHFPFVSNNGFNLDAVEPGLEDLKNKYIKDPSLIKIITSLGAQYLSNGDTLLHGDFYPGSWLKTQKGLVVIDPEFSYPGYKEFDLGVLVGHLTLTNHAEKFIHEVYTIYQHKVDRKVVWQYAGVEILRRLIGVAQLPIKISLSQKEALMDKAVHWLCK